jgi:predicted P-loop ATPase
MSYDYAGLNAELCRHSRDLLPLWLPGGRFNGSEYVCASIKGGKGESFSVNIKTGAWGEFSGTERGGDLVSLYGAVNNVDNGEAYRQLSQTYVPAVTETQVENPIQKPPVDAAPPAVNASAMWRYNNPYGEQLFYIARFDGNEGKIIRPYCWSGGKWVNKGWPSPRPLYNLHLLSQDLPVLIVEGEKAADAAAKIVGDAYVVTTWTNGVNGVGKTDWSAINNRKVLIWPDCDLKNADTKTGPKYGIEPGTRLPTRYQPGMAAGLEIAKILQGSNEVKIITFDACEATGTGANATPARPAWESFDGWDAADALREGWGWQEFYAWAKPRAMLCKAPTVSNVLDEPYSEPTEPATPVESSAEVSGSISGNVMADLQAAGVSMNNAGKVIPNIDSLIKIFTYFPSYKNPTYYDEFHDKIFSTETNKQWREIDDLNLAFRLQRELGILGVSDKEVRNAITVFAHGNKRNEPKEWLESLKWDGTERIDSLFVEYFGSRTLDDDDEYHTFVSKNFLISMVARILDPGCKVDNMVILEGEQGTFKSTALSVLGGKFAMEAHESVLSKDFYQTMRGKFLVIINELQSFSRAEVNTVKNMITRSVDTYRKSYGRDSEDHYRSCIFVGVTNEDHYLHDSTGARRFWPIRVHKININKLKSDRDQLFAEAVHRYKAGEDWHTVPLDQARKAQEQRRDHDEWEPHIMAYVEDFKTEGVLIADILTKCVMLPFSKITKLEQNRVGRLLRANNWISVVRKKDGASVKVWKPHEKLLELVNNKVVESGNSKNVDESY